MKRTKFIMLALVVALVLMGAGYAAWTQVFTIDSTIKTGELFVVMTNPSNSYSVENTGKINVPFTTETDDDYLDLTITPSGSATGLNSKTTNTTLTYTLNDLYPGVSVTSNIKFENKGTMPTTTTYDASATLIKNSDSPLWNDIVIKIDGIKVDLTGTLENKKTALASALASAVNRLEPLGEDVITIIQELPLSSGNLTDDYEGIQIGWTVNLVFEQYNAQTTTTTSGT